MEKICFVIRSIALLTALTACSGLNPEVIAKDVELLEEINEDILEVMESKHIDNPPLKKRLSLHKNPRMHDKVINLNYEVSQRSSMSLA